MANYEKLKQNISSVVRTNGKREITGNALQGVLNNMVNSLGDGYKYMGVATVDTDPGTPDGKVFYLAQGKGIYANFGINIDNDGINILKWDGLWSMDNILTLTEINDAITTANGKITANTNNIASLTTKVNALNSAYRVKGTKATIAEVVALTDAVVGDVWNVTVAFSLSGKPYPAGTNVVCVTATSSTSHTESNWDALGGTVDLSPYAKSSEVVASHEVRQADADILFVDLLNKAGNVIDTIELPEANYEHAGVMTAGLRQIFDEILDGKEPVGKATVLANTMTIDGIPFDGSKNVSRYGVCETSASTQVKTFYVDNYEGPLKDGDTIYVRFMLGNTADNPILNLNFLGEKPIYYGKSPVNATYIRAERIYTLIYETYVVRTGAWLIIGDIDTNTTYPTFTGATSSAAGNAGLVPAPTLGKLNQVLRSDGVWADIDNSLSDEDRAKLDKVDSLHECLFAPNFDPNFSQFSFCGTITYNQNSRFNSETGEFESYLSLMYTSRQYRTDTTPHQWYGDTLYAPLPNASETEVGFMTPAMLSSLNTVVSDVEGLKSTINISSTLTICTQSEYNAIQDKGENTVYFIKG